MIASDDFRRSLDDVDRLLETDRFEEALRAVEAMIERWPGNAHLRTLCASLLQLQESPDRPLDDAKQELLRAVELDPESPEARIELAHFLNSVEDDPAAAREQFSLAVDCASRQLKAALQGRIDASLQLGLAIDADENLLHALTEDPTRVNLDEDYEVAWWSKKFGVSADQLREAVKKVGPMAKDVEKQFAKK